MTPPAVNARDLVRDPASLLAIALLAAVLGAIGWFSFAARSSSPNTNKKLTHMHCPACREEIAPGISPSEPLLHPGKRGGGGDFARGRSGYEPAFHLDERGGDEEL